MECKQTAQVVLCWHMHQPSYKDASSGEFLFPWVYLHAVKDYADMAAHLEAHPKARAVVNFAPVLLEQIEDYLEQIALWEEGGDAIKDPLLRALVAKELPEAGSAAFMTIIEKCLRAHPERIIKRFAPYEKRAGLAEYYREHPEIQQYLVESNIDAFPIEREFRSLVYQRAKGELDTRAFGTQRDVYQVGYEWASHSLAARAPEGDPPRVRIGGPECSQPYESALLNISAMSFGSLSANAILALNAGARKGGFYHDTGEGGISRYHREHGGDQPVGQGVGSDHRPAPGAAARDDPAVAVQKRDRAGPFGRGELRHVGQVARQRHDQHAERQPGAHDRAGKQAQHEADPASGVFARCRLAGHGGACTREKPPADAPDCAPVTTSGHG